MKYKFNDTFIELGFIKELLKEFNLPNIPVAVEDSKLYIGKLYIKDLGIYRYLDFIGKSNLRLKDVKIQQKTF